MKKILFALCTLLLPALLHAQFTTQGKISYERKTNVKMQMQGEDNEWIKSVISQMPKTLSSFFVMNFTPVQSAYHFDRMEEVKGAAFFGARGPARENSVLVDFDKQKVYAKKEVFETTYIVEDSMRVLEWKIEDEMRTIAGYPCRKAVAKILDSVVVVAFYTDQIMVSGGPECFNGLPGMILGLAIPRLYTTWFATNVELISVDEKAFSPFKKGKRVKYQQLYDDLVKGIGDWGKYGTTNIWWSTL